MTYTNRSCPHCRHPYQLMSMQKEYLGAPIRTCVKCRKVFHDPDAYEAAFLDERQYTPKKIADSTILLFAASVMLILLAFIDESFVLFSIVGFGLFLLAVCLCVYNIISYNDRIESLRKERAASEARVSDPFYVIALIKLDYDVPKKYLDIAKPYMDAIEKRMQNRS